MKPQIENGKAVVCSDIGFQWTSEYEIRDAGYYEKEKLVVVIVHVDGNTQRLVGLNLDNSERFSVEPPNGWFLYYLSSHIKFNVAVVCVSDKERFDWFFGINPNTGELTSLNRSH